MPNNSGISVQDFNSLVTELKGSDDTLHFYLNDMGLDHLDENAVFDDLIESGLINICEDCGLWDSPESFEDRLCVSCFNEAFDENDEDDDIFGFNDGDFDDDDDVNDEDYEDYYFDETDDEDYF